MKFGLVYNAYYFVNCLLIQTIFPGLLGVCIQDGDRSGTAAILDFKSQRTQGISLDFNQQMVETALMWTLQDMLPLASTEEVAEAWSELFRFIAATMMEGLRRSSVT